MLSMAVKLYLDQVAVDHSTDLDGVFGKGQQVRVGIHYAHAKQHSETTTTSSAWRAQPHLTQRLRLRPPVHLEASGAVPTVVFEGCDTVVAQHKLVDGIVRNLGTAVRFHLRGDGVAG